jgi:anthranilate synthase component I
MVYNDHLPSTEGHVVILPDLDTVKAVARDAGVIPVCKSILADTETPVSVWMKLFKGAPYSFLLESVTGGDEVARYSFLGANPFLVFCARGKRWRVERANEAGDTSTVGAENGDGDPVGALRSLLNTYRTVHIPGLPRFCGGAVGFFTYDSVRLRETIPDSNSKEDPLDDIVFAFYRDIVAFDNLEHRLLLISNIMHGNDEPLEVAYNGALETIGVMERALESPVALSRISIAAHGEPRSNVERAIYEQAVEKCREYIRAGDIFQVVLSQRFSVPVEADPFDLYRILRVVNPSPYMY